MDKNKTSEGTLARRSFLQKAGMAGVAVSPIGALLASATSAQAHGSGGKLRSGDIAILRFLAAAEIIESDLWIQYAELGGIGDNPPIEIDPNQQLNSYQAA